MSANGQKNWAAGSKERVTLSPCHLVTLSFSHLWPGILLGLLFYMRVVAVGDIDTLVRGNQLYEKGDFQAAAQLYEQLVAQGVADSTLYYNLGNAYYKQGELGRAILNYTRAARLAPRDADIRANLALARSQVQDQYETTSESPLGGLLALIGAWLTLDELAFLALAFWTLCAILWIIQRRLAPGRPRDLVQAALIIGAILLLTSGFALGGILQTEQAHPLAIVLNQEVTVVSGPGTQYTTEFTLHSGAQVSLMERRGEWVRIALPGEQMQGWTPAVAVGVVEQ